MPLGLSPRETTISLDRLSQMPTAVVPPVSGSEIAAENIAAPFKGIASGVASTYEAAATAATSAFANYVAAPLYSQALKAGDMGMNVPPAITELEPDAIQRQQAIDSAKVIQQFAPDPRKSGAAAQVLHGVTSMGVRMIGGSLITGSPFGGAALVGATEGSSTRNSLIEAGVDTDTANKMALGSAMFSGAGAMLPGGVGKTLVTRMLSGAGIQLTAGIANRTMMHVGLEDAGYPEMAKQYMALDGAGLMSDAILGAVFGAVHHAFAPEIVDSAHNVKDAEVAERAARGPAVSPESRDAVLYNDTRGAEALIAGHDLSGTKDVETVPDPAQDAARATAEKDLGKAGEEVAPGRVVAPAEPEPQPEKFTPIITVDELQAKLAKKGVSKATRAIWQAQLDELQAAKPEVVNTAEAPKSAESDPLAAIDPADREALDTAQAVLAQRGETKIGSEEGAQVDAGDALRRAIEDIKASAGDEDLHRVMAACAARG